MSRHFWSFPNSRVLFLLCFLLLKRQDLKKIFLIFDSTRWFLFLFSVIFLIECFLVSKKTGFLYEMKIFFYFCVFLFLIREICIFSFSIWPRILIFLILWLNFHEFTCKEVLSILVDIKEPLSYLYLFFCFLLLLEGVYFDLRGQAWFNNFLLLFLNRNGRPPSNFWLWCVGGAIGFHRDPSQASSHMCLHADCEVLIGSNRAKVYCFTHEPLYSGIPLEYCEHPSCYALAFKKDKYCWHHLCDICGEYASYHHRGEVCMHNCTRCMWYDAKYAVIDGILTFDYHCISFLEEKRINPLCKERVLVKGTQCWDCFIRRG